MIDVIDKQQEMKRSRTRPEKPTLERVVFSTSRLLDFCSEKELIAQTGHEPAVWPLVVVKELLDNALDACEDAGIVPHICVTVDEHGIAVQDNGPGLGRETVKGVLDFSVRVSSRDAYVSPTRGAQGNALKTVVAMPFVLHGEQGNVEIASCGIRHSIALSVDRIRQMPIIEHKEEADPFVKKGTFFRVQWPESPRSILSEQRQRFLQIVNDCLFLNPHLTITWNWFDETGEIEATDLAWRKWLPSAPTSAHWYRPEHFERLIASYLTHDGEGGDRTVRSMIAEFNGLAGTGKQKQVLEATGLSRATLADLKNGKGLNRQLLHRLLSSMKEHSRPVQPIALGLIGEDHLWSRFDSFGCAMETFRYRKTLDPNDGLPTVLEIAFAWRPEAKFRRLITGANWSPAMPRTNLFRKLGDQSLSDVLESARAGIEEPVLMFIHLACPRIEFTDRGKAALVIDPGDSVEAE